MLTIHIMKGSNPAEGGHSKRETSGSTEKKDKVQGEAPTVNAASLAFSPDVATQAGNPSSQNGFDADWDGPTMPQIASQFTMPQVMPQAVSNDPAAGMSSMAAVLLALRMVGLSPSQPNSQPVIWIPVDVPHPPMAQTEGTAFDVGNAARATEQPALSQQTPALEDLQKHAAGAGRDTAATKGKNQYCRVHGAPASGAQPGLSSKSSQGAPGGEKFAASGAETKPAQIQVPMNLAKNVADLAAATDDAGKAAVMGKANSSRPADEVPGCAANVNVGVVALPGALATFMTAGLGAVPALRAAVDESRGTVRAKEGKKDEESGKLADHGENVVSAGRTRQNTAAVYLALAVLIASLVAAFCLLLVVESPSHGIRERAALSPDERSGTVERTTPTVTETDPLFQSSVDTNEQVNEPVVLQFSGRKSPRLAMREPVPINDTTLDGAVV